MALTTPLTNGGNNIVCLQWHFYIFVRAGIQLECLKGIWPDLMTAMAKAANKSVTKKLAKWYPSDQHFLTLWISQLKTLAGTLIVTRPCAMIQCRGFACCSRWSASCQWALKLYVTSSTHSVLSVRAVVWHCRTPALVSLYCYMCTALVLFALCLESWCRY